MKVTSKFCGVLLVVCLVTACSRGDENAILELKASMDACGTQEAANMESISNQLECVGNVGNNFFAEQCGEEEAFTNIIGAVMQKAMVAAMSGDEDANTELGDEEIRDLAGDCVADLWREMEEMGLMD